MSYFPYFLGAKSSLSLIWVGFLEVLLLGGLPCLKRVTVRLESPNSGRKHTYVVLENILFSTKTPLILLISAFFAK